MTKQLTFQRGNYTGNWVEDEPTAMDDFMGSLFSPLGKAISGIIPEKTGSPSGGSGSLQILFKDVEEIVLHDKAEHAAEKVFTNYVTPDHHHMAKEIFYKFTATNISMAGGIKAIAEDDRCIQHDVHVLREILKSLLIEQGYNPSNFPELDNERSQA